MVSDARGFRVKASLKQRLYSVAKPAPRANYKALVHSVNYWAWAMRPKKISIRCYA